MRTNPSKFREIRGSEQIWGCDLLNAHDTRTFMWGLSRPRSRTRSDCGPFWFSITLPIVLAPQRDGGSGCERCFRSGRTEATARDELEGEASDEPL